MHATAAATSNIALVKYWGKRDVALNLPATGSISVTLDRLATRTTVTFDATWQSGVDHFRLGRADDPANSGTRTPTQPAELLESESFVQLSMGFEQRVGNIPPGEEIVCEVTIDQRLVWLPEGAWEWRFPTVVGARYMGPAGRVADAEAVSVSVSEDELATRMSLALDIADWNGPDLRRLLWSADLLSESAISRGSSSVNTPASRSSASLVSVTCCDQRLSFVEVFLCLLRITT